MWSSKRLFLFLAAQPILFSQSTPQFTCPATITVTESASVASPWQAETAKSEHKFERPSIYNGDPGKQEYDLAPDDTQTTGKRVKQTWNLTDYRKMNLFIRCRYQGTPATVVTNLPAPLKTCTFTFQNTHPITTPTFTCK
jgi:hypothetical protein